MRVLAASEGAEAGRAARVIVPPGLDLDQYLARGPGARYDMDKSLRPGSVYGIQLLNLHTATRLLLMKIEGEEIMGMPTRALKAELLEKQREPRTLRAYLLARS